MATQPLAFFMPMDGRYIAKSQDGGAIMPMDGRTGITLLQYLHFHLPWWSYDAERQGRQCVDA